jgi:hypothetical protein
MVPAASTVPVIVTMIGLVIAAAVSSEHIRIGTRKEIIVG